MSKPDHQPTAGTPVPVAAPDTITRIRNELSTCIEAREQLRLQLNGIENQIYILEKVLAPPPPTPTPSNATPPGTI